MATNGRPTISKRQREIARQRKKRDKEARRARKREERDDRADAAPAAIDPDIAGIVPGPQPHPFMSKEELDEDELPPDVVT